MFIGNFKSAGNSYSGVIQTLTFKVEAVFDALKSGV